MNLFLKMRAPTARQPVSIGQMQSKITRLLRFKIDSYAHSCFCCCHLSFLSLSLALSLLLSLSHTHTRSISFTHKLTHTRLSFATAACVNYLMDPAWLPEFFANSKTFSFILIFQTLWPRKKKNFLCHSCSRQLLTIDQVVAPTSLMKFWHHGGTIFCVLTAADFISFWWEN